MRIGLVSDNHGLVDPALATAFAGVDEIWHAGDLVTRAILDALEAVAPVVVVRGNNDLAEEVLRLPEERVVVREGWKVLVRHIVGRPGKIDRAARASITRHAPDLVVCGHSHQPMAERAGRFVLLNPGSAGPRRFRLPRAAALLVLTPAEARVRIFELDSGETLVERTFEASSG